ncbi:MAG: pilA1 [Francisellaceae bacterium]|nr:pilA1 [Francisellaceae bacterium]
MAGLKKGFSLIELMIVIAIIGILAAVAIPNYQLYVNKSRMMEVIGILESFKTQAMESYNSTGSFPATVNVGGISLPNNGSYVTVTGFNDITALGYSNNVNVFGVFLVEARVSARLGGGTVAIFSQRPPTDTTSAMKWYCGLWDTQSFRIGTNGLTQQLLPSSCSTVGV